MPMDIRYAITGLAILLFVVANQIGWDDSLPSSYGFPSFGTG